MKAIVFEMQVGGLYCTTSLYEACKRYIAMVDSAQPCRTKIRFAIKIPSGETRGITIRDEDGETVAYGDFRGLPNFLDYCQEMQNAGSERREQ